MNDLTVDGLTVLIHELAAQVNPGVMYVIESEVNPRLPSPCFYAVNMQTGERMSLGTLEHAIHVAQVAIANRKRARRGDTAARS